MGGRVTGKKCLVYGGGTGIGLACAEALMGEGAAVFLSGRREPVLETATMALAKRGRAGFAAGDATSVADVQRVTEAASTFMGGLDTLVISAGAGGRTPIFDTDPDEFQRIMDNTLRPVFLAVRFAASHLLAAGKASVIAISSTYGLVGHRERVAYCGAKAGVNGMVKAMALDFADKGVRVNADLPRFRRDPARYRGRQSRARPQGDARRQAPDASDPPRRPIG